MVFQALISESTNRRRFCVPLWCRMTGVDERCGCFGGSRRLKTGGYPGAYDPLPLNRRLVKDIWLDKGHHSVWCGSMDLL